MSTVDQIDQALMSAVSQRWSKAAMVIARAMAQLSDVDDISFQQRLKFLAMQGRIEASGDLAQIRHSEVRLVKGAGDV